MDGWESTVRRDGSGITPWRARIVGRDAELARIAAFLERELPATLRIEGEAGIGKSVLWEAATAAARPMGKVLAWRASEAERAFGFAGLLGLFEPVLDERLLDRLHGPRREALEVALGRARGHGAPPEPALVGMAVADLLHALAGEGAVVLAIDDVQWLDEPSAGALGFAIRRAGDAPIGLIVAARMSGPAGQPASGAGATAGRLSLADAMPADRRERIQVGPLSVGALGRLLHDRLGVGHPRPVLLRLHQAIDGNPFLGLEAARSLAARGLAPGAGEPLPIPPEAGALVRDHLSNLGRDARRAVLLVAMSSEPTRRVVEGVLGSAADAAIDEAVALGILRADSAQLRAIHPLFTSTVHSDAPPGERRAMHRRLAELARQAGHPIEAAIHLGGSVDAPDAAVAAAIEAGADDAAARGMPATAADLLERAAALSDDSDAWAAREIAAAEQALAAGDADRAERLLHDVLERVPAGPRRARALAALGEIVYVRAPVDGLALLRSGLEHVGDDRLLEALIHSYIVGMADPDFKRAIRSADRAVEILDGLDVVPQPNLLAAVLLDRAFQWLLLGERVAVEDIERGVALLDLADPSFLARRAEESAARSLWMIGRVEEAMALDEAQYRHFSDRGQLGHLPQLLQAMATMRLHTGSPDIAERHTREIEDLVEGGEELWRERAVMARVWITAYAGDLDAARALAGAGLARQEAEGDLWEAVIFGSVLGWVELAAGDPETAFRHLATALARNDEMSIGLPNAGGFLRDYVEAAVLTGRLAEAEAATRRFEEVAARLGLPWEVAMAARSRALVEYASGRTSAAIGAFGAAIEVLDRRLPVPMDRGRVLLLRGEALRRLGRRREARASIDDALWTFESIGANGWAARARAELGRLGGRAPAGDALTTAERSVAELAATGLTNRQIADRLVVSVRTVENQLSAAYGKLGVASRRQLAAAIAGLGPDLSGSTDALASEST